MMLWDRGGLGVRATCGLLPWDKRPSSPGDEFPGEKFIPSDFLLDDVPVGR